MVVSRQEISCHMLSPPGSLLALSAVIPLLTSQAGTLLVGENPTKIFQIRDNKMIDMWD